MRDRSAGGQSAVAGAKTTEPEPPQASAVACPECFQVGTHLDGCPEAPETTQVDPRLPAPAAKTSDTIPTDPRQALPNAVVAEMARTYPPEILAEGAQVVDVVWGKEYWQPIQFHGVEVGPFRAVSAVRQGESDAQARARVYGELEAFAREVRKRKIGEYLDSLRQVQDGVASRAVR